MPMNEMDATAEIIRLQERMRMMENTVREFRSDIKDIKAMMQMQNGGQNVYSDLFKPLIGAVWAIAGAALLALYNRHF